MNGLLLSLPGTPVIYYGDEIGMGDNVYLGDRNGVRTPMQWTADRNGGFSRADPARLYAPPIMDPVYGYQSVNVEAQERVAAFAAQLVAPHDRAPAAPSRRSAAGRSSCCRPENRHIFAFIRRLEGEDPILVVANIARDDAAGGAGPDEVLGARAGGDVGRHRSCRRSATAVLPHARAARASTGSS